MKEFLIAWKDAAPAAGAITAIISGFVAFLVFRHTRIAARRRATLDMVMKTLMDNDVQERAKAFKTLLRRDENKDDDFQLVSLAADSAIGSDDRRSLLHQLNIYELMALGIRRKIFDEAFYKRWFHNQFMKDYESCSAFVAQLQLKKASIFCESSSLYRKWLKNGHPESSPSRIKLIWWVITKQDAKIDAARAMARAR